MLIRNRSLESSTCEYDIFEVSGGSDRTPKGLIILRFQELVPQTHRVTRLRLFNIITVLQPRWPEQDVIINSHA